MVRVRVGVSARVKDRSGISVEGKKYRFVLLEKRKLMLQISDQKMFVLGTKKTVEVMMHVT